MKKLIKAITLLYFFARFRNWRIAHFLAKDGFPLDRLDEISVRNDKVIINKTGQAFDIDQIGACRSSFDLLLAMAQHEELKLDNTGKDTFITWHELKIKAAAFDNYYVASELFMEGLYSLHHNKNLVVCDVGMNVGVASLFFANMSNVKKVYSFEPFKETYDAAIANFQLNPAISDKIVAYNMGAGGSTTDLVIPVSNVDTASKSTTDFFLDNIATDALNKVTVKIRDIREVITDMLATHQQEEVFLKLDCEGAEYEIMEKLNESGLLQKIRIIIIEWHFKGPELLSRLLDSNGFSSLVFPRPTRSIPNMGMIYAFRQN
jgi:FkbM family methyltransferase